MAGSGCEGCARALARESPLEVRRVLEVCVELAGTLQTVTSSPIRGDLVSIVYLNPVLRSMCAKGNSYPPGSS